MPFETFFSRMLTVKVIWVKVAQLLSLRRRNAVQNICVRRLKVKVTLERQMIKWS